MHSVSEMYLITTSLFSKNILNKNVLQDITLDYTNIAKAG